MAYRQCPKRLWLELHKPELRDDSGSHASFARGDELGRVAQQIFDPKGVGINVDPHLIGWDASSEQTQVALRTGDRTVFEALLQIPGAMALADVMRPDPNFSELRWEMIGVKASTSVKDYHRDDVAIQTYIADESGVPLSKSMLAHIDTNFVYAGDGDYSGLLHLEDLTDEARARHEEVGTWIEEAQAIAAMATEPVVKTGEHCNRPFACDFCGYCKGGDAEKDPFAVLPRLKSNQREQFKLEGVTRMEEVPADQLTEIQARVLDAHLTGQPFWDPATAANLLRQNSLPAYFLELPVGTSPVPIWKGTRPYEFVSFQFSLHKLEASGDVRHMEFLDISGEDPRRAMAEKLIQDCGDSGSIYAYAATVEASIIKKLEKQFPDFAQSLESIRQRIVGLLPIVKQCYYHPSQQGSWSLKAVMEPMMKMFYNTLDVPELLNGEALAKRYYECIDLATTQERKEQLRLELLDSCQQITYAELLIHGVSPRVIRVFLSSTFRDFAEERDLLVKKVFPELRRLCRERQVELVEVDLRWGITAEEAEQGKVLPICLGEIDRARPYFMGFIGDRYGWVPEGSQYPAGIVEREPWLKEHAGGKSVTELEMLHGVLNNPEMAGRAFFYFRDSNYSQGKGGDYLSEDDASAAKLKALKDRIRASQFPVVEDYPDPQALADKVRADLRALIEEEYPADEVPDDLTLERMRHEAYSQARRKLYIGGENYFSQLDAALSVETPRPVLISGEAGLGKSALIASWLQGWRAKHPKTPVILHHLNATAEADDPMHLVRRVGEEAALITGRTFEAAKSKDEILEQLPSILADLSSYAEREGLSVLIVLDGLERCGEAFEDLRWFPKYLPPHINLLASCSDGSTQEHLQNFPLDWTRIELEPLSEGDSRDFIERYLKNFRKSLTPVQAARILAHPLSGRPLWLLTLLEELRQFGVHEDLEARLETLLSDPPGKAEGEAPTIDDLYEHVLGRIEEDIDEDYEVAVFKALWASYDGLARSELLELTGMPPAKWAEIQSALDENLFESGGQITFGNDFIRKAVEDRHLPTEEDQRAAHRWLGEWFEGREVTLDVAQERVHQWRQAGDKDRLRSCLRNPLIHKILYGNRRNLVVSNWLFIVSSESFLLKSCELLCVAEILSTVSDYEVSRNLANAVLYSNLEWSGAFEQNPLDGRGGTYTFSVVWTEFITTQSQYKQSKLITELIELSGTESLNMAALYALCFYFRDRSRELSEGIFEKILNSSPWAKVVLTNLAIEFVLMGKEISFTQLVEEFWHPFWEYDRAEIDLLKGAMRFMGYNHDDDPISDCAYYNYLENKRLELLSQANEPSTANLLRGFWLLDPDRESLHKQLRGSKSEDIDDILMLFLAYPVWTVSDLASDVIFSRLCVSKSLLKRVREAAFDVNGYHAFSAFKCYAKWLERSQNSEELRKLITVASQSDFCHIRGQTAEYMMELLRNTPVSNLRFLYLRFKDSLNIFLCDTDIWSFQEVFHNLHDLDKTLESVGIYWRESLNLEDSKFLKLVSGWNNLGGDWDKFNEQATLRLKKLLPNDGSVKTDLEAFKQLALAGYLDK